MKGRGETKMEGVMVRYFLASLLALTLLGAAPATADIVKLQSPHSPRETMDRFEAVVKQRGLTVFARIDHAAGAQKVDLTLRPTELLIFGNPRSGTPLMQASQTMGLALPMKVLVWQDAESKVWIGYDAPADAAAERGVPRDHPVVGQVTQALQGLTAEAVKP
jgi:uncharacterized protein (DUF302 family)